MRMRIATSITVLLAGACSGTPGSQETIRQCPGGTPEDCWRPHWPVDACPNAVHAEVVGLWATVAESDRLRGRLVYDGCDVVIIDTEGPAPMDAMALRLAGWALPSERSAYRTRARWDGPLLISDSVLGRRPVARRVSSNGESGLRIAEAATTGVDVRRGSPDLVRVRAPACLDAWSRALLCAQTRVPRCADESERFPDCQLMGRRVPAAREAVRRR